MFSSADKFVVYNLRETYHEVGDFEFKIVLNPKNFKSSHLSDVSMFNPDGKEMKATIKKWGRKIMCSFTIDQTVPDGVAVVKMNLKDEKDQSFPGRLTFWVIK